MKKGIPFYLILFGFFLLMIAPFLTSHGMFMDGIIYATISNNLANGIGSYSDLFLSETIMPHFREHPPLAIWLLSFFYRIFGDSFLIEKVYSALTFIITGWGILKIWKQIYKSFSLGWLPILFWLSFPIITQAARNNLLENTMMIFLVFSFYYILKYYELLKIRYLIIAGFLIFLAALSKGFVALFIWSVPLWYFIFNKAFNFKKFLSNSLIIIGSTLIPFFILILISPELKNYFIDYFEIQVSGSLKNSQTVDSRFWILIKFFKESISALVLLFIFFIIGKLRTVSFNKSPIILVLLLTGLAGVIPIIISLKQSGFYFLAALPFIAISFAAFVKPIIIGIDLNSIWYKALNSIGIILIGIGVYISISSFNSFGRDQEKIIDIIRISENIPEFETIGVTSAIRQDWSVIAYFYRYGKISLLVNPKANQVNYFLNSKGDNLKNNLDFKLKPIGLNYYNIYQLENVRSL